MNWPLNFWINHFSDHEFVLQILGLQPRISIFFRPLGHFFLAEGLNNLGNKIPIYSFIFSLPGCRLEVDLGRAKHTQPPLGNLLFPRYVHRFLYTIQRSKRPHRTYLRLTKSGPPWQNSRKLKSLVDHLEIREKNCEIHNCYTKKVKKYINHSKSLSK